MNSRQENRSKLSFYSSSERFSFLKFCIKGPIVYYIQGGVGEGGGGEGIYNFTKRLDFGGSILKMRRM